MKVCKNCGIEKENNEFNKCSSTQDGLQFYCRECTKNKLKQNYIKNGYKYKENKINKRKSGLSNDALASRRYYLKNKKEIIENKKQYYTQNKEKIDKVHAEYLKKNETARKKKTNYSKEYDKNRKIIDPLFKLKKQIKTCISNALSFYGYTKKSKTHQLLCCLYEEFLSHLGPKPEGDHHLDHICPCAQAQNEEELIKLQHYTNFRWLPAKDNLSKNDKRTPESEKMCKILLNREWID